MATNKAKRSIIRKQSVEHQKAGDRRQKAAKEKQAGAGSQKPEAKQEKSEQQKSGARSQELIGATLRPHSAVGTQQSGKDKKTGSGSPEPEQQKSGVRSQETIEAKATAKTEPVRYARGTLALQQRTLPHGRFVEFPLVKGKVADRVELFTATNNHSLTIGFQDETLLHLDIAPGFTVNAQFMRRGNGDLETLAEWPPIHISAQEP